MKTLRCLISNMPQKLLSDIVLRTAREQMNIEVIGEISAGDSLRTLVREESIDLLLMGIERSVLPHAVNEMLDSNPDLLIVGLVDDGRRAAVFMNDIGAGELKELISTFGPARTSQPVE